MTSNEIEEQLKWVINGIDIVGCELTQNISKKLENIKKQREKNKLKK